MMTTTDQRLSPLTVAPDAMQSVLAFSKRLHDASTLDAKLTALVQLRASQINGCAFCTIMHANDARDAGETDDRLTALAVWRDTPWFTERERIALEWTERLTDLAHSEVDDALYERALRAFGERGLVDLTLAVAAINAWNRLNVPFRTPPDPQFRSTAARASVP